MDFQLDENLYKTNEPVPLGTLILLNRPFLQMSEIPYSQGIVPFNLKALKLSYEDQENDDQTFLILEYLIKI